MSIFSAVKGSTPHILEQAWARAAEKRGEVLGQDRLELLSLLEFRASFNDVCRGR